MIDKDRHSPCLHGDYINLSYILKKWEEKQKIMIKSLDFTNSEDNQLITSETSALKGQARMMHVPESKIVNRDK